MRMDKQDVITEKSAHLIADWSRFSILNLNAIM
jgi:hypothetical protein